MSRGKPAGERGENAELSTRELAARAAGLARAFRSDLRALRQYVTELRADQLRLSQRVDRVEELLESMAQDAPSRRETLYVGISGRQRGSSVRARPAGVPQNPGTVPDHGEYWRLWEDRMRLAYGSIKAVPPEEWERAWAPFIAGGELEAGGAGLGSEPLVGEPSGEGAGAPGASLAGGEGGGGSGGAGEAGALTDNIDSTSDA